MVKHLKPEEIVPKLRQADILVSLDRSVCDAEAPIVIEGE